MTYSPVKSKTYGRISASTPGTVWTVGDFEGFGSRAAVHKVLQRLTREGNLRRVAPGFYDRPRLNKLTGKPSAPDYRAVIDAIARRDHVRMLVDGMTAANDLALSDAVPGRVIVHSDARLKPVHLGHQTIVFRPTAATKLYWAGRPAMRIVQALHWLKPKLESAEEKHRIQRGIEALLNDPVRGGALRRDLQAGLATLPLWMQAFVRDLAPMQPPPPGKTPSDKAAEAQIMSKAYREIIAASDEDRRGLFLTAAERLGTTLQNIEKDFWVCWTLDALFHRLAPDGPRLLFKACCPNDDGGRPKPRAAYRPSQPRRSGQAKPLDSLSQRRGKRRLRRSFRKNRIRREIGA